jgi:hypothetical protein
MLLGTSFLRKQGSIDIDAQSYINAVEVADGQPLETNVKSAVNTFVVGCKQDGIWNAIKACCILAGSRTLSGALVPLKGTAPTNFNFVTADYNRKTGLKGDGFNKYLDSNRLDTSDPQNNAHLSVFISENSGSGMVIGIGSGQPNDSSISLVPSANTPFRLRGSAIGSTSTSTAVGLLAVSRSTSSVYISRVNNANETINAASATGYNSNYFIFRRNVGSALFTSSRLSFYSIGESINLTLLDSRITNLMNTYNSIL